MPFEVALYPIGGSGTLVELQLVARMDPPGIEWITLRDAHGFPVEVPPIQDCPTYVELRLAPISTYRLPLYARARQCETGAEEERGPLLVPGRVPDDLDPRGGGALGCTSTYATPPSQACIDAAAAVRRTRVEAVAQCDRNQDMKREAARHREWANRLWVAAGVAIALAAGALAGGWIGAIFSAIMFGIAAALTYAAIVAFGLAERWDGRLAEGRDRFRELRDAFDDARAEAARSCCPGQETYDASDVECDA